MNRICIQKQKWQHQSMEKFNMKKLSIFMLCVFVMFFTLSILEYVGIDGQFSIALMLFFTEISLFFTNLFGMNNFYIKEILIFFTVTLLYFNYLKYENKQNNQP